MIRRHRRARWAAVAVTGLLLSAGVMTPHAAYADDTTVSYDTLRTGWDPNEAALSPSNVSASDFGKLFTTSVNGQVYAQPVVVAGTLIVATENNYIYGMNPATGAVNWSRSVGPAWPASTVSCGDLTPNIGITSTPVYDPATGSVFFTAKVNDGPDANNPHWYMHSIDPATGAERSGWPVVIQGKPSNDPTNAFNPATAFNRAGLLLLDGVVYAGFASHCDHQPYVGYVAGVKTTTPAMSTLWSAEAGRSSAGAGIWESGGGLVSDGSGRIILSTGNGVSPPPGPGSSPPSTLAESVVRLQVNADGTLSARDFFSPSNNGTLDQNDTDLGSGGPLALPNNFGTTSHPHLLVQDGKDGRVFLLDRDNLGGMGQAGGGDNVVGVTGPYNGMWGHPAFWGGDGGYVYTIENAGYLRALKYGVNGSGNPVLSSAGVSPATFGYTSGSPVVTSNGSTAGSAVVWIVYSDGSSGTNGQLRAYDAVPVSGQLHLRYSAPIGTAAKFATPGTDAGRVYVGTRDGTVVGFGRPTTAALTASPVDFGNVAVNSTANSTVTVTASRTVTISAIATAAPFGTTPPALPVTLTTGQTLNVPVSFHPTTTGGAAGSLTFTTDSGNVAVDLHGNGTQTGLGATPSSLTFGSVPTGTTQTQSVNITNTGTSSVTISSSTPPAAPFTASGFPANGSTLAAGASVSVTVAYSPTVAGSNSSSLVVASSGGSVTVPLSGTAVTGSSHMSITPNPLDFGNVTVGASVTKSFTISNTGNINMTITKAAPPAGVFSTSTPVSEGQQLAPGQSISQSVTFSPTATGAQSAVYQITADDGQGAVNVQLTGTGVTGTGTTNVAAGKPASASTVNQTYVASNVTDADVNTYWESANNAFPQWVQVDLGSTQSVGKVVLKLPPATAWAARTQTLQIQGSTDGTTFTGLSTATGYTFDPATGNTVTITFPFANARYVRANITGNTGWPAGQVSQFEVYIANATPTATLAANPTSLLYGSTVVGSSSATQNVTISNSGSAAASISSISTSAQFTQTNTCGTSLAAGASCTATVTFKPTATGTQNGTLTVSSNATNNTLTVSLSGTGAQSSTATLAASPTSLTFPSTSVGSASATQNVTVTNSGTVAATVSSVTVSGDFSQTNTCGTSIAAGASCTATVTFRPTASGSRTGTLTVNSNATNPTLNVALSGSAPTTTRPATSQIEAESYDAMSGVQTETTTDTGGGLDVGYIANGDWVQYNNVDFGTTGINQITARVASGATSSGTIEVRLDSLTNAPVGTVAVGPTGGWQTWVTKTGAISATTGVHTLYLRFADTASTENFLNVNWFTFGVTTTTSTNLAAGRATSSSSNNQTYVSSNVTDADANTYWESANNALPQWVQVDLGSTQSVSRIVLKLPASWGSRTQTLSVLASTDGTTFATVKASATYTFDPASGNTVTITFPATSQRYFRLNITANSGWPAGQISDFQIWNT
jgi:hypothetical protein